MFPNPSKPCLWDMESLDAKLPAHLLTGSMRYRDRTLLGKGGKAEVFKCRDSYLGREVACKILHRNLADRPLERQMLVREARITAALGGDSVPTVHEIGRDQEGRPYFAMELVEGTNLKETIDNNREGSREAGETLGVEEFLAIVAKVAKALAEAHQLGVVHADVKPENLIVGSDGKVTIVDWGIASITAENRLSEDYESIEQDWGRQGSALFMSPEQASREQYLSPSSDIYSLGAVLYECLSFKVPLCGKDTEETLSLISNFQPTPPSVAAPGRTICAGIDELCLKALAKDPEDRFASMAEFAACITDVLHDRLISYEREDSALPASTANRCNALAVV